jgi:adenine deaminase
LDSAAGKVPSDLVVIGGRVIDVHLSEIYEADIAIKDDRIVAVGNVQHLIGDETEIIDAAGRYVTPGLIDCHIHVGGSHLSITEFARAVVPRGTTAVATDFYETGVVTGLEGIKFSLEEAASTPLKILFVLPVGSYLQNRPFGANDKVTPSDLETMLSWEQTIGLNEPPPAPILQKDPVILGLIKSARAKGKIIVGHACELTERELNAYMAIGASSDHECSKAQEAFVKSRLGMHILVREGSAARDLESVIKAITETRIDTRYFAFCTDEKDPIDLARNGHIDHCIRKAVRNGVDPITAVEMGTLNAAEYFRVDDMLGSISPGKIADILIVDDLPTFKVVTVIANGRVVCKNGEFTADIKTRSYPQFMKDTIKLRAPISPNDLQVAASTRSGGVTVRVIGAHDGTLISERQTATLQVVDGQVKPDPTRDILKIAVAERHRASGRVGIGFISGFGIRSGAVASSYNPVINNLLMVGTNDEDMCVAANSLVKSGGGFVFVRDGNIVETLDLPLMGILSDRRYEEVSQQLEQLHLVLSQEGCTLRAPFLTLGFMAMPYGIPSYKISEYGLVDVEILKLVDVVVDVKDK